MSTTKTQRIVSLVLAIVFFASTIGIAAYYVLANKDQQDQQAKRIYKNKSKAG